MKRQGPALRVITGDLAQTFTINGVSIRLSALQRRLPAVEALVVEQDTGLLLDETIQIKPDMENLATLSEILLEEDYDYPLGCVLPKQGQPLRLHTVIHDLNQSPNWNEAGIEQALNKLFTLLPALGVRSLAMPAPAHHHGALPIAQSLTLLCDYLAQHHLPWRGELWLLLPRETLQQALAVLHTLCDIHQPE